VWSGQVNAIDTTLLGTCAGKLLAGGPGRIGVGIALGQLQSGWLGPGPNGAGLHCACGLARLTISIAFPDK
jgi:hypothetical protein